MCHIRTTQTSSKAIAVQIVKYSERKLIVVRHIGSAHNKEELSRLKKTALLWIEKESRQRPLFSQADDLKIVQVDKCRYLGMRYGFIYEVLMQMVKHFGFSSLTDKRMFIDLVIVRIIEPSSKPRSLELLEEFFNIRYLRKYFYRDLNEFVLLKDRAENKALTLAKKEFNFDFSLVFYDVTTLYFETFQSDEFRKTGFSKDNKPQQPQIVIGLIVDDQGFPVAYEIFEGSKFEGHTFIPVISSFKEKHNINRLTVVADAAMISLDNVKALSENNLSCIVGARIGNLSDKSIRKISLLLGRENGKSVRLETKHGFLVCDFSEKRRRKDKADMTRQMAKAEILLKNPSRLKRVKFVKGKDKAEMELNNELIKKTELLLGIKGYYTNLPENIKNSTIIDHYHNLWHVEQVFRVAKSELEMRPIFHFKKKTIEAIS